MKCDWKQGLFIIIFLIVAMFFTMFNRQHLEARKMAQAEKRGCLVEAERLNSLTSEIIWDEWSGCVLRDKEQIELVRGE